MNVADLARDSDVSPLAKRFHTLAKSQLFKRLPKLRNVNLTVVEGNERQQFGDASGKPITVTIYQPEAYSYIAFGGSAGAGESYFLGLWDVDDLVGLIRAMVGTEGLLRDINNGFSAASQQLYAASHWLKKNNKKGSRQNIQAHYDLGNDFFETFLDPSMMYSCAVYPKPEASLEDAQYEKLDRICRKLALSADDHVVEIGTGWGGFAIHAAKNYGCKVTTTTISDQQFALATERVQAAGLEDKITVLKNDYRDLTGKFDKLVSIEMIEAVGDKFLNTFFKKCADLLKPDGLMLLQVITCPDQDYKTYLKRVDFIQRFVFPGGCLPSLARMSSAVLENTDLNTIHQEDLAPHYAKTLNEWRIRLTANRSTLSAIGYDLRLLRLWDFYLASCEAGFTERMTGLTQMMFMKPNARPESYLPDLTPLPV